MRMFWRGFVGGLMKIGAAFCCRPYNVRRTWREIDEWIDR